MASLCLQWDTDDLERRSVLETAARFCDRVARPLGERPEIVPTPAQMAAVIAQADEAGLLPQADMPGIGLWTALAPDALLLSTDILAQVAAHSAAAAFHLHQTALGRRLRARLGLANAAPLPCLYGEGGLAKGLLGPFLEHGVGPGRPAPAALFPGPKTAVETSLPLLWPAADPWDAVVLPVWRADKGDLAWAVVERGSIAGTEAAHGHGLEGVTLWRLAFPQPLAPFDVPDALGLYREMLALDAMGLVAVGLGSARAAVAAAKRYAHERRQGGKLIAEHAAVRLLLGGATADTAVVETLLRQMTAAPRCLGDAFYLRSAAHPLLCRAASSALQVFGGYGYMRDFGLERALRDNNVLRLCAGSPNDLVLTALAMEDDA